MSEKRIRKEIVDIYNNPPDGISAGPIDENNIYHWEAVFQGPDETDYKNGVFLLDVQLPKNYPFSAPRIQFKTKIFHPNIDKETGEICLNVVKGDWAPNLTIANLLLSIYLLLYIPNFKSPLNGEAKDLYNNDKNKYSNTVQEWVKLYSGKVNTNYKKNIFNK